MALCGDGIIDPGEACDDGNIDHRGWCGPSCGEVTGPTQRLYAAADDGSLYVIDVATKSIVADIPNVASWRSYYYRNIRATPDGNLVVSVNTGDDNGARANLIETKTNTIAGVIDLTPFPIEGDLYERAIAISADSRTLFLTSGYDIFQIDIASGAIERAMVVGPGDGAGCGYVRSWFEHLALSPDGRYLFRSIGASRSWLSRLSTKKGTSHTLCGAIEGDDGAVADALQMSCDGKQLHVLAPGWSAIVTVNPSTMEYAVRDQYLGSLLQDEGSFTDISRDGATLFWSAGDKVSWMDVDTDVVTTMVMPDAIGGIALVTVPQRAEGLCDPTPMGNCMEGFASGSLLVKEDSPGSEKVIAKFAKGPDMNQADLGNPIRPPCGNTRYALCIYDGAGALKGMLDVDRAGHRCSANSELCWHSVAGELPNGKGYGFKDTDAGSDGVTKLRLRSGSAGSAKVLLKAQNDTGAGQTHLPTGIAAGLAGTTHATMQLVTSDAECFSVDLSDVRRADASIFKRKR